MRELHMGSIVRRIPVALASGEIAGDDDQTDAPARAGG